MARPNKTGLDYFPFDVNTENDEKVQLVEARHEQYGFLVLVKLWCRIYNNGYYYNWTNREQLLFSKNVNVNINEVNAVINSAIEFDLFDKTLFDAYEILTSRRIQETFLEAIARRKDVEMVGKYILVNINAHRHGVKVNIIGVNAYNNPIKEIETETEKETETENIICDVDVQLISSLLNFWGFNEMRNPDKQTQAYHFLKILTTDKRLDYFTSQFSAYKTYKTERKEIKHGFDSFLGSIDERFLNGGWNAKNWEDEVKHLQTSPVNGMGLMPKRNVFATANK